MRKVMLAGVSLFAVMAASSAGAAPLFQSIPDLTVNPAVNAWCSSCGGPYRIFDTFSLGADATINQIDFAVQTGYHFPSDITVSIHAVSGGLPDATLYSQIFAQAAYSYTNTPNDTSIVTVNPAGWSLAAGTYNVSFYNPVALGVPGYSDPGGVLFQQGHQFHLGQSAAFRLSGDVGTLTPVPVPAPAGLALLGAGLLGLGLVRRKTA